MSIFIYLSLNILTEAQIRFLKAKLRVMEEELNRLSQEYNKKVSSRSHEASECERDLMYPLAGLSGRGERSAEQ